MADVLSITGKNLAKFPDVIVALALVKAAEIRTAGRFGLISEKRAARIAEAALSLKSEPDESLYTELWFSDLSEPLQLVEKIIAERAGVPLSDVTRWSNAACVSQTVESIIIRRRLTHSLKGIRLLESSLREKSVQLQNRIRIMRTHLNESIPGTWGRTIGASAYAVSRLADRLEADKQLFETSLTGSVFFDAAPAPTGFAEAAAKELSHLCGFELRVPASSCEPVPGSALLDQMTGSDRLMLLSADIRALAMAYTRLCHGLFIFSSGPRAGIAEITLPAIAPGSTIMPGKINPSMPMLLLQIAEHVLTSDQMAVFSYNECDFDCTSQSGGAFIMAAECLEMLGKGSALFTEKCLRGFDVKNDTSAGHADNALSLPNIVDGLRGKKAAQRVRNAMLAGSTFEEALKTTELFTEEEASRLAPGNLAVDGLPLDLLQKYR